MKKRHVKPLGMSGSAVRDSGDCFPAVHLPECNSTKGVDPCQNSCQDSCKWACQSECKFGCKGTAKAPPPPKSK